jgi:hypothetical protein
MSGTVKLPREWNIANFAFGVRYTGAAQGDKQTDETFYSEDLRRVPGEEDTFEWSIEQADVGPYRISLGEPPAFLRFTLGPQGASGVRFVVPPPTDVSVFPIDEVTGKPVLISKLAWTPKSPDGSTEMAYEYIERRTEAGTFQLRAPVGDVFLSYFGDDGPYAEARVSVTLIPGTNEVRLPLARVCGLLIECRDGEQRIALPDQWRFKIERDAAEEDVYTRSGPGLALRVLVSAPGEYKLSVTGESPMYLVPTPRAVQVAGGEFTPVVLDLQRKR